MEFNIHKTTVMRFNDKNNITFMEQEGKTQQAEK